MAARTARWRGRAFGLDISGDFAAPGLEREPGPAPPGATELRVLDPGDLEEAWRSVRGEPVFDSAREGVPFTVKRHPGRGYLIEHGYYGSFAVSADGTSIGCAPRAMEGWRWQRLLVGQLLPLASALRGLEPIHASAVSLSGRALLCLGASGSGKSSVALHLADRGARFLSDDVTVLEAGAEAAVAHPGATVMSVAAAELARLSPGGDPRGWARLGEEEGDELRVLAPPGPSDAVPVGAVFVLNRRDDHPDLSIEPLRSSLPALLGATFNAYHRAPSRLAAQFAACGELASGVPLQVVRVPAGADASRVAGELADCFLAAAVG